MIKSSAHKRLLTALVAICLLVAPISALDKKGAKNYKDGIKHEAAQQWERAAQEFALAVAADPSNTEFQLHYRRAVFNASQMFMQRGRSLAERNDYTGAYNAFRQAYGYDQANELALSEMERMLRLQRDKNGGSEENPRVAPTAYQPGTGRVSSAAAPDSNQQDPLLQPPATEQRRIINYNNIELENVIRNLAEQLNLNIIFDRDFPKRAISINLRDVTLSQALDNIFISQGLFFQKLNRRTILVADQTKRIQYQPLSVRTFYLSNAVPEEVRALLVQAIPPQQGRQLIAHPNKSTNSLTVRDTPENMRLIENLIKSVDKDRAEVVMDVNIYEVSRTDLLQFGNQIGQAANSSQPNYLGSLGSTTRAAVTGGSRGIDIVSSALGGASTGLGAALLLPAANFAALQSKTNSRLLYSNQIHAFDNEESQARIGQRVPVQTAQTFPLYGGGANTNNTNGNINQGIGFGGGFPVFNYEPTGLTLKFTPQVFPNRDVQVKMSIESKDVLSGGATPTFTERTITGTARIQNGRTMMLASVAQDAESTGREGLPLISAIPILGRLFSAPTRNNRQSDIVIAVTPRVLRAPDITPGDQEVRPSGTLQAPTTETLEAMLVDVEREEQIAAARTLRAKQQIAQQLPQPTPAEGPAFVPAPKLLMDNGTTGTAANSATTTTVADRSSGSPQITNASAVISPAASLTTLARPSVNVTEQSRVAAALPAVTVQPTAVPAAMPVSNPLTATPSSVITTKEATRAGVPVATPHPTGTSELQLVPDQQEMRIGEKRRLMLVLNTDKPLSLMVATLRFDPRHIAVRSISKGNLFAGGSTAAPTLTHSVDPKGALLVSVTPPTGASPISGAGVMLIIEVEGIGIGASAFSLDKDDVHLVASDGRKVPTRHVHTYVSIKQ